MQPPKVSIQFEHLSDAQQKDALFENYDRTNREKVRSSFRLPPIFVGLTTDYTRATARESRSITEEQVFAPEREDHDFVVNRLLFPVMGVKYWSYRSLAPDTNDVEIMSKALETFCTCGLTVKEAREEMSRLLNRTLAVPEGDMDEWMDLPLSVYLVQLQSGADTYNADFDGDQMADEDGTPVKKNARPNGAELLLKSLTGIQKALEEDVEDGAACPDPE